MRFVLQSKAASRESVKSPLHSAVLGEKWWFYYEERQPTTPRNKAYNRSSGVLNFTVSVRSNFPVAVEKQYKMKSSATQ